MFRLVMAAVVAALPAIGRCKTVHVAGIDSKGLFADFTPENELTVSLLLKPELPEGVVGGIGMLLRIGSGYYDGLRLSMAGNVKLGGYYPSFELGNGKSSVKLDARMQAMKAGCWYRLTGSWDGLVMRMYLNGEEVASRAHSGRYVKPRSPKLAAGDFSELYGLAALPVLIDSMSAWDRALSPAEIGALGVKPSLPETPRLSEFFRMLDNGEKISSGEVSAWRQKNVISPAASEKLDEILAFALLSDGRYGEAAKLAGQIEKRLRRNKDTVPCAEIFHDRFADAAVALGFADAVLPECRKRYGEAKRAGASHWPYVGLRLMALCRERGMHEEADRIKAEILASDLSLFPHLNEMFGRPYQATAQRQKGASLPEAPSRKAFFVAPGGDDGGAGGIDSPFATLTRARDAVRRHIRENGLPDDGVTVYLRGGRHRVKSTLTLTAEDGGGKDAPVAWRAYGDEIPVLCGGFDVPALQKVSDPAVLARMHPAARGNVLCADLRAAGFAACTNEVPKYGFHVSETPAITELYENGERLVPARFPDEGYLKIASTQALYTVTADLPDLEKWAAEKDLAATGFWKWLWADLSVKVSKVDPRSGELTLDAAVKGLPRSYTAPVPGNTFFLFNALYAISRPGEWYLDRASGVLYVWPKARPRWFGLAKPRYVIGAYGGEFLRMTGVENVRIEGIVFEYGSRSGIAMKNCRNCVFAGNTVRNFAGNGMTAHGSRDLTVRGNVFRTFGHGALAFSGGSRKTLTPSGCVITCNEFADVENRRRTYAPHLHLSGVGTEVSFNHFHDAPSSAMRLEGNDFFIASNLVENVVLESDDQGGLDIYFNASYFGNRYCWNVWRNIGRVSDSIPCGQAGVRFDGNISGQTVYANRFVNCGTGNFGAIQSCGGRLHVIDNNIFEHCNRGMSISNYPLKFWTETIKPTLVRPCLQEVCITNAPFSVRYRGISDLLATNQVNHLLRNITIGSTPIALKPPPATVFFGNIHLGETPDMSALSKNGYFAPVPTAEEVGPRNNAMYRRAKNNDEKTRR